MADQDIRDAVQLSVGWLRILITGSRDWRDRKAIFDGIFGYLNEHWAYQISGPHEVTIMQGGQVSEDKITHEKWGADYFADQVAWAVGFKRDLYPADWKRYGKRAGRIRNQEMVDTHKINKIYACLAFPLGRSPGTRDCMRRADAVGIPVINLGDREVR